MDNINRTALWQERVNRWRESGLSQRRFALREGYPVRQMGYWVRRLRKPPPALAPVALLPVSVKPALAAATAPMLTLSSASGWNLTLPSGTPANWLAELLRAL
jgi:hypothetical protein